MMVYVNDAPVHVLPGMTVKHALLRAGILRSTREPCRTLDQWGNEIGLDGALCEGMKIYVRRINPSVSR